MTKRELARALPGPALGNCLPKGRPVAFDALAVTYMSRLRAWAGHITNAEYELQKERRFKVLTVEEKFTDDFAGQMNKDTKIFVEGMFPPLDLPAH